MKAKADEIGVTGYIQRYLANDLKLVFEGTKPECRAFLLWLTQLQSAFQMIEHFDFTSRGVEIEVRSYASFMKVKDFSTPRESGGKVIRGPHSDTDMDKSTVFSADRNEFFGTRSPLYGARSPV